MDQVFSGLDAMTQAMPNLGAPPWDSPSDAYQEAVRETICENRYWYEHDRAMNGL
jgi:hypothetical protein